LTARLDLLKLSKGRGNTYRGLRTGVRPHLSFGLDDPRYTPVLSFNKKLMKKIKLRYKCPECGERFKSWQARSEHYKIAHKPPVKIVKEMRKNTEFHSIIGGINLNLGDKISIERVGVITKITKTEGSKNVDTEVSIISSEWSKSIGV